MNTSSAVALPPDSAASVGTGNQLSPSFINSIRISACMDRLLAVLQSGKQTDAFEFYSLCLSLARGIDYALANGEIPTKAQDLPKLMKQVCQQLKNDELSQAALMVLLISVKNACKIGWFQRQESEEICTIADELGKIYNSMGNVNAGPNSSDSIISTIMQRFYPKLKLGPILASIEAKPGYGASAVDFHITKSTVLKDKIFLFVAQVDNIETSACLISPQQVNFLLNGKGVERRTNVLMETGPQMPTNVTGMLKYGTNLLQAVGQFNGHYVILVAYMSITSLSEHPVLLDYVQTAVTSIDSDSDIIEGPSQISLHCPISFTRIKTPVKGHLCKHFQCFDFDNYININSSRPSWRCPHCNQYVCFTDIRRDRNMVEILEKVGENIKDVTVLADGSWKAVLEKDPDRDKAQSKTGDCEKEQTGPKESTCSPSTVPNVLDLTNDDANLEIMDICESETADKKPFQAPVQGQSVPKTSTSLGINSSGVNQDVSAQIDNFWSEIYNACGMSDSPRLSATVSPTFNQESEGHDINPATNSAMHNQFSAQNNLQLTNYMNSLANEYGISASIPRNINRTPIAVQALPVPSQQLGPQQNSINNLNSFLHGSSSTAPHVSLSNSASADAVNAILSDTERQQHLSRPQMNLPQVSNVTSPTMQHNSATKNRLPPVNMSTPTQFQNTYRGSGSLADLRNPHLQQSLNPRQLSGLRPSNIQHSHPVHGSQAGISQAAGAAANSQQGRTMSGAQVPRPGSSQARNFQTAGASANSQQPRTMSSAQVARPGAQAGIYQSVRTTTNSQQAKVMTAAQPTRPVTPVAVSRVDELFTLPSEQEWRPTAQMRGSLAGRACPDEVRQLIIRPTQETQSSGPGIGAVSRPQGLQPVRPTGLSSQLNVLIANNKNAHKST